MRQWKNDNPAMTREHDRRWNAKAENKRKRRKWAKQWHEKRVANDPSYRVSCVFRNKFQKFAASQGNVWKMEQKLGFTHAAFVAHIESQFRDPMSWENYGVVWHLDHIRPVSSFVFANTDDPQFIECWSLGNLQPLFVHENLTKGAKYDAEDYESS